MFFNPKLFKTEGSTKLFVCNGVNAFAQRFGGCGYRWQPVKRLIWKIWVNDGEMFLDTPLAFEAV